MPSPVVDNHVPRSRHFASLRPNCSIYEMGTNSSTSLMGLMLRFKEVMHVEGEIQSAGIYYAHGNLCPSSSSSLSSSSLLLKCWRREGERLFECIQALSFSEGFHIPLAPLLSGNHL